MPPERQFASRTIFQRKFRASVNLSNLLSGPARGDVLWNRSRRLFGKGGAFAHLRDVAAPIMIQAHDVPATVHPMPVAHAILNEGALVITAVAGHHRDAPAVIYRIDYAGTSITFSGDIDAQGLPGLRTIAKGSDLLVFNSVVLDPPGY